MYVHGEFVNQIGDIIALHIVTNNDRSTGMEIGDDDNAELYFSADDTVEIENEVNDTFDHLLCHQATVRLLARNFMSKLFCSNPLDAVVNIYKNNVCVFAGFITPQAYSQSYNDLYDELELNCIDVLSALQFFNYRFIGIGGTSYDGVKSEARQRTFLDILIEILNKVSVNIDIAGGHNINYYYDGSKAIDKAVDNKYKIFEQLGISELLFLDDTVKDVWTQHDVVDEIFRYLNLHIVQEGFNFYIFDWASIKGERNITFTAINGYTNTITVPRGVTTIKADIAADAEGTSISIGEVFNKLEMTIKTKSVESVIESPLDDNSIVPAFFNRQKYMTEYICDGEGITALHAFYNLVHGATTDYVECDITDWYLQVMKNPNWLFPINGGDSNFIDQYAQNNVNQQMLPNLLRTMPGASMFAVGSITQKGNKQDNSPKSNVNLTNYLVISVNGNGIDNDEGKTYPHENDIKAHIPYAVYIGNTSGGVFSPSDENTINYIVISGKILLNPIMPVSGYYSDLRKRTDWYNPSASTESIPTVNSRNNTDGR